MSQKKQPVIPSAPMDIAPPAAVLTALDAVKKAAAHVQTSTGHLFEALITLGIILNQEQLELTIAEICDMTGAEKSYVSRVYRAAKVARAKGLDVREAAKVGAAAFIKEHLGEDKPEITTTASTKQLIRRLIACAKMAKKVTVPKKDYYALAEEILSLFEALQIEDMPPNAQAAKQLVNRARAYVHDAL